MKPLICITLLNLSVLTGLNITAQEVLTVTNRFENHVWICQLQEADLAKAPRWNMRSQDNPPLAPGKAMQIAEKYVSAMFDDGRLYGEHVGSIAIAATLQPEGADKWFYIIKVVAGRPGSSGNPPMQIIVLMDGRIPKLSGKGVSY